MSSRRQLAMVVAAGLLVQASLVAVVVSAFDTGAAPWRIGDWLTVLLPAVGLIGALVLALWWQLRAITGRAALIAIVGFAVVFRLTVLPLPPALSEDVSRYVWDGQVTLAGISPYAHTPDDPELEHLRTPDVWANLNSADKFSVYPPVMQALYAFGAGVAEATGGGFAVAYYTIKTGIALADIAAVLLLVLLVKGYGIARRNLLLYAWNPLPILEYAGAGHSDAVMVALLLAAFVLLQRRRKVGGCVAFALAILAKLLPLVLVPFLARRIGWKWVPLLAGVCVVGFLPFINTAVVRNVTGSLGLYFSHFEFNGGVYWLIAGMQEWGSDAARKQGTGPIMAGLSVAYWLVLWLITRRRNWGLERVALWVFGGYLCLATTVHPWYIGWALCLAPLFPTLAWQWLSLAAFVSCLTYTRVPPTEDLRFVAVEWIGFAALLAVDAWRGRVVQWLMRRRGRRKAAHLAPYVRGETLLDLGAGEGYVAEALADHLGVSAMLADVIDMNRTPLPHVVYDGARLPFADGAFDTVIVVLTLHHCHQPDVVLREAARVARLRVIVTESVYTNAANHWLLTRLDRLANNLRSGGRMDETLHFRRASEWEAALRREGLALRATRWLSRHFHLHVLFAADCPVAP